MESHGGRIWVEPNPMGGTIFKLTLKTVDPEEI
jgi:two-component system sensor kinase FixL